MSKAFNEWLDLFCEEKRIDDDEIIFDGIGVDGSYHVIEFGALKNTIKNTTKEEQQTIKSKIVYLDFKNADIRDFFKYLAKALTK